MASRHHYVPVATSSLANRSIVINRRTAPSLKKTIQLYKAQLHRLEAKHDQLLLKRADLNSKAFVVVDENKQAEKKDSHPARHTVGTLERRSRAASPEIKVIEASASVERSLGPSAKSSLVEQPESYHPDVNSLISTATTILIESLELRLGFLRSVLSKLDVLYQEAPKLPTPPELGYQRYEEWVGSNQRLLELNAQLYEIERLKFELKKKQSLARKAKKKSKPFVEEGGLMGEGHTHTHPPTTHTHTHTHAHTQGASSSEAASSVFIPSCQGSRLRLLSRTGPDCSWRSCSTLVEARRPWRPRRLRSM